MHFLGSGGSQRFSEITAGGGWVAWTVWRDMTFDLKGRRGSQGPRPRLQGGCWRAPRACALLPAAAAARFPHERWQFAWCYFLDTARPRRRCTLGWARLRAPRLAAANSSPQRDAAARADGRLTCDVIQSEYRDMSTGAGCTLVPRIQLAITLQF